MISQKSILYFFVAVALLHFIATINNWYWIYQWLDKMMHFLAGFWVAMAFFYLNPNFKIQNPKFAKLPDYLITAIMTLGFVALIGVLWEFFEFTYDAVVKNGGYAGSMRLFGYSVKDLYKDTLGDLFFDLLGGLICYFCLTTKHLITRKAGD